MISYDFVLLLDREATAEDTARLFEVFEGDVMPGLERGQPVLDCSIEAPNLTTALGTVMRLVLDMGFGVSGLRYEGTYREGAKSSSRAARQAAYA